MKKIIWTTGVIILSLRAISMGRGFDAKKESRALVYFMGSCAIIPAIGLIVVLLINYFR